MGAWRGSGRPKPHLATGYARTPPILQTEDQMPTYACSAADGRLTPAQKLEIVQSITAIHHD
jgi:hypothetical protein